MKLFITLSILFQIVILIYNKNIKKYFKPMANNYDNSFIDADILDGKLIFTRVDGSTYELSLTSFQDTSAIKNVNLTNNALTFTKINGDITNIDLSTFNNIDNVTLDSSTKDLIFYCDTQEVIRVNFDTIVNNSFISGNPFVSASIMNGNLVFTKVSGDTQSISIHNFQNNGAITDVTLNTDTLKFTYLNGDTSNIDLSKYHDLNDVIYNDKTMDLVFYKNGAVYKNINIKTSVLDSISASALKDLSTEIITRQSIDDILSNNLSLETYIRTTNHNSLSTNVSTNLLQRISTDNILSTSILNNISTETYTRISTDNILSSRIITENSVRLSTDNILSTTISSELSTQSYIMLSTDNLYSNLLSSEIIQRVSLDKSLSTQISSRTSTDYSLTSTISSEIIERVSLDRSLSTQISSHTNRFETVLSTATTTYPVEVSVLVSVIIPPHDDVTGNTWGTSISMSISSALSVYDVDLNYILTKKAEAYKNTVSIPKNSIVWDGNGRVKVTVSGQKYIRDIKARMIYGWGRGEYLIDPNITYQYNIINAFYLSDTNNRLRKDVDFISLELEYNTAGVNTGNSNYTNYAKVLGKNIINVHNSSDWQHSIVTECCVAGINAKFNGDFGKVYTSFAYSDLNQNAWNNSDQPPVVSKYDTGSLYESYTYAAKSQNQSDLPEFLEFGSHYGNAEYDVTYHRGIGKRHDITSGPDVFFNSIACAARLDDTTTLIGQTSYGYGIEFFEDCSFEYIRDNYGGLPICDSIVVMAHLDGTRVYAGNYQKGFAAKLAPGDTLYIRHPETYTGTKEIRTIVEVVSKNEVIVDSPYSVANETVSYIAFYTTTSKLENVIGSIRYMKMGSGQVSSDSLSVVVLDGDLDGVTDTDIIIIRPSADSNTWQKFKIDIIDGNTLYINQYYGYPTLTPNLTGELWIGSLDYFNLHKDTPGHPYDPAGQAQSWAVPIICSKFNVIRNKTGFSWKQIRDAARYTAKKDGKNSDGYDWDMYRGFGKIDIDATIARLKAIYSTPTDKLNEARNLETSYGLSPVLEYNDLYDNSPISKKMVKKILNNGLIEYSDNDAAKAGGLVVGDFYRTGDTLKVVH